jgi:hypothetical protein
VLQRGGQDVESGEDDAALRAVESWSDGVPSALAIARKG